LARACDAVDAALVYPSTDCVFAGNGVEPYGVTDDTAPINAYGRSKEAGERAALACKQGLVVRTS
jgi:dTDP-4-dehydrorhamnose reductase